jgi:MFS superfamily sulfate permease-like transporter
MIPVEAVPPCPLRFVTGIPCPMCGMTRGVTAAVHGNLGRAFELNPASIMLVLFAVVLLVTPRVPKRLAVPLWAIVAAFAVMWTFQLFKYSTGRPL